MSYRRLMIVSVFLAVAAIAYFASRVITVRTLAQAAVSVSPFTLEQTTLRFSGDSTKVIEIRTTARRADGSQAIYGVFPNDPGKPPARRVDFADGRSISVFDAIKAKMSVQRDSANRAAENLRLSNPPENCLFKGEEPGGSETLLGVNVVVARREGGGGQRMSEWRAPSLQCFPLAMKLEVREGQSFKTTLEVRANFLATGEPSALLFDESSASQELAPSELKRAVYSSMGITEAVCPTCFGTPTDAELDSLYYRQSRH